MIELKNTFQKIFVSMKGKIKNTKKFFTTKIKPIFFHNYVPSIFNQIKSSQMNKISNLNKTIILYIKILFSNVHRV